LNFVRESVKPVGEMARHLDQMDTLGALNLGEQQGGGKEAQGHIIYLQSRTTLVS
jgi:hypothetical protein